MEAVQGVPRAAQGGELMRTPSRDGHFTPPPSNNPGPLSKGTCGKCCTIVHRELDTWGAVRNLGTPSAYCVTLTQKRMRKLKGKGSFLIDGTLGGWRGCDPTSSLPSYTHLSSPCNRIPACESIWSALDAASSEITSPNMLSRQQLAPRSPLAASRD